jgi:hypothetical protein
VAISAKTCPNCGKLVVFTLGKLAFAPEVTGRAATIGSGREFPTAHTALLATSIFDPEHGTVEAWYRQTKDPEPYVDNPHRIRRRPVRPQRR